MMMSPSSSSSSSTSSSTTTSVVAAVGVSSFVVGLTAAAGAAALLVHTNNSNGSNINKNNKKTTRSSRQRRQKTKSSSSTSTSEEDDVPSVAAAAAAHEQLIENGTPLIKLRRVSKILNRNLFVKMESLNPGGTGKDRAALSMIRAAEEQGLLPSPHHVDDTYCSSRGDDDDDDNNNNTVNGNGHHAHYDPQDQEHHGDDVQEPEKKEEGTTDSSSPTTAEVGTSSSTTKTADTNTSTATAESQLDKMIIKAVTSRSKSWSGGLVIEGTSGSTGIALATLCASRGHACLVVMPDDQAVEKQTILRSLGAVVHVVPTASISNPCHYVNLARTAARIARDKHKIQAVFIDQFENLANFDIHYNMTGPEIWDQLQEYRQHEEQEEFCEKDMSMITSLQRWWQKGGHNNNHQILDAFVMSSGTGGTISGCGHFMKEQNPDIRIVLVDPPGSSLHNKIQYGVAYASQQQERTIRKHRYDTLAEGIGLDRITQNFSLGLVDCIDGSIRVTDQEAVDMAHWILRMEGLWMGSSSAMNLVGAVRTAMDLPPGSSVVTMMCDGGQRHVTRFWDPSFVKKWGLKWPGSDGDSTPECLQEVIGKKKA